MFPLAYVFLERVVSVMPTSGLSLHSSRGAAREGVHVCTDYEGYDEQVARVRLSGIGLRGCCWRPGDTAQPSWCSVVRGLDGCTETRKRLVGPLAVLSLASP